MKEEGDIDLVTVEGGHVLMDSLPHARSGNPNRINMKACRCW